MWVFMPTPHFSEEMLRRTGGKCCGVCGLCHVSYWCRSNGTIRVNVGNCFVCLSTFKKKNVYAFHMAYLRPASVECWCWLRTPPRLGYVRERCVCVCSSHETVLSTYRHPAPPALSVLIFRPRDTRSVVYSMYQPGGGWILLG